MIAILNGRVLETYSDSLVIGVGGIGLQVFVPSPLRDRLHPGDEIFLHTYLVVRQDSLSLYGFETREERDLYLLLLSVDGIGPKSASGGPVDAFTRCHPPGDLPRAARGVHPCAWGWKEDRPKDLAAAAGSHPGDQRVGNGADHL